MSRALITGGSSGIGAALVRRLATDGWDVTFTFCRSADKAQEIARETGTQCVRYDLTSAESVRDLAATVQDGEFDGLINNASLPVRRELLSKSDPEQFLVYQTAALRGVLELSTAFAAQGRRRGSGGSIVNVLTSYILGMPPAKLASYVTSKHALLGLTRSMAVEFVRHGIRVNAVSPGMTRTEFVADLPQAFIEQVEAALPMSRLATAEEVAGVVRFLLSNDATYINGANVPVCGGQGC